MNLQQSILSQLHNGEEVDSFSLRLRLPRRWHGGRIGIFKFWRALRQMERDGAIVIRSGPRKPERGGRPSYWICRRVEP